MKKLLYTLMLFLLSTGCLKAQEPDSIMQPTLAIGKSYDGAGQVIRTYRASLQYDTDGRLQTFTFPEFDLSTTLDYEDNLLMEWHTTQPMSNGFTFLGHITYYYDNTSRPVSCFGLTGTTTNSEDTFYHSYDYDDQNRLIRKERGEWQLQHTNTTCWQYWLYDYEEEGRTKIETEYHRALQGGQFVDRLSSISTYRYSDDYALLSVTTDKYANNVISEKTMKAYSYDGNGFLTEFLTGIWSDDAGDWDFTEKTVYEYNRSTMVYTISFYKKNDGEWVRDVFTPEKAVFLDHNLSLQEECLKQMSYESMYGYSPTTGINQFELTMQYMKRPSSSSVDQNDDSRFSVFPNPGKDDVRPKTP